MQGHLKASALDVASLSQCVSAAQQVWWALLIILWEVSPTSLIYLVQNLINEACLTLVIRPCAVLVPYRWSTQSCTLVSEAYS